MVNVEAYEFYLVHQQCSCLASTENPPKQVSAIIDKIKGISSLSTIIKALEIPMIWIFVRNLPSWVLLLGMSLAAASLIDHMVFAGTFGNL